MAELVQQGKNYRGCSFLVFVPFLRLYKVNGCKKLCKQNGVELWKEDKAIMDLCSIVGTCNNQCHVSATHIVSMFGGFANEYLV